MTMSLEGRWECWEVWRFDGRLGECVRSQYAFQVVRMKGAVMDRMVCIALTVDRYGGRGSGREGLWNSPRRARWSGSGELMEEKM